MKENGTHEKFDALAEARRVLSEEAEAVLGLAERLDEDFERAVEVMFRCRGRVIVTGMGKSGLVGKKIASTLSSTGTPTLFLHPAEGLHGDLGVITPDDVALALSYSGETDELLSLLPFFKRFDVKIIAVCGERDSTLGRSADMFLSARVEREACPLGITPTTSSTATLAMGDALAMALLRRRGFRKEDFALRHPAGRLGRQLLLRVADLQHTGPDLPVVGQGCSLGKAIEVISGKRLGMTTVVDDSGVFSGVITDGDLRRILERDDHPKRVTVRDVMTRDPKTIDEEALAAEALRLMETHAITSLVTVEPGGAPKGVIHIHDILKAGIR